MISEELAALEALSSSFNWTLSREDVWRPSLYHVEGLHPKAIAVIYDGIIYARDKRSNPLGVVLVGEQGAGKTHLLGWTREQVRLAGGYFFLVGDLTKKTFWEETRSAILDQLLQEDGGQSQLTMLLDDLAHRTGLPTTVRDAVTGRTTPTRRDLDYFIAELKRVDKSVIQPGQDVARALVLLASPDSNLSDIGHSFLAELDLDDEERRAWGIRATRKDVRYLVSTLSRIIALSGPAVVAVDQIDSLIDKVTRASELNGSDQNNLVAEVAGDLMALRDLTFRTLTVIACLGESWDHLRGSALVTVSDRFYPAEQLQNIPTPEAGRELVAKRFAPAFSEIGFVPPYPTWPIRPAAFENATAYTARTLLKRVESHISRCRRTQSVRELSLLDGEPGSADSRPLEVAVQPETAPASGIDLQAMTRLDARFAELRASIGVDSAFDPMREDAEIPPLLAAGLDAWIRERGGDGSSFRKDPRRADAALHGCLRMVSRDRFEHQHRWAFRAIAADHPRAVQSRVRKAVDAAGLTGEDNERQLFLLRNTQWPTGPRTEEVRAEFEARGGKSITVSAADLKTFAALHRMIDDKTPELDGWLVLRQPAHQTELLTRALGDVSNREAPDYSADAVGSAEVSGDTTAKLAPLTHSRGSAADDHPSFRIGTSFLGQAPMHVDLASLRKHVAVFAGSGSGKTVLLRRIIEECALHGVSSIVLDPNNDLARLGDPWPEPPSSWTDDDADRARRYLDGTDVVVWTPRRQGGRPLAFRPLPAFADLLKDPNNLDDLDEFDQAVEAAVEAIAPRLNAYKATDKANLERAVLKGALRYFGRAGGSDLGAFTALLAALPPEASTLPRAPEIASKLAERLEAIREIDPLFGGSGEPVDPGMLLTPDNGKHARISVISMIGLTEDQRPGFVNQLQMALFSWIKKNPAGERPLGGLLVMDEAQLLAPATGTTASTQSTLKLASQARKYGLGLLFATQAPRGLHNQIPNNAATQFFGRVSSPAQIETVQALARVKGGNVPDIGRLGVGEFYLGPEGRGLQKIRTPICLSHYPSSPLTAEEVIMRARRA